MKYEFTQFNLYEEVDDLNATENREPSEEAKGASDERELGDKIGFSRSTLRGSYGLSARRAGRTKSRGPKGLQLEVRARRAP